MNPWSKIASLCALALSVGVFAQVPEARAQDDLDYDEIAAEDEEVDVEEAESSLVTQPLHGSCRSYCNRRFTRCLDSAYRGGWRRGWGWRGRHSRAYARCENQRDFCIASCRRGRGW